MIGWSDDRPYSYSLIHGRIEFPSDDEVHKFWLQDLTLPVLFNVDGETDDSLTSDSPGEWHLVPDGLSVMIWVHWSVPSNLKDVVAFHELIEAKLYLEDEIDGEISHRLARAFESAYAREYLNAEELKAWCELRTKIDQFDNTRPLWEIIKGRT